MNIRKEFFADNPVAMDLFTALAGEHLGTGAMRSVYRYKFQPAWVMKFEFAEKAFSNVTEYDLWAHVWMTNRPLSRWFAPCTDISPCGHILWQKFIPNIPREKLPKLVPACFADLKQENWGLWKGRPVCRDYGNNRAFQTGLTSRLVKANWH